MLDIDYGLLSEKIFKMKIHALFSTGETVELSRFVKRTRITNDYINFVMPHIRMVFALPLDTMMMIQRDRDQVVFSLEIEFASVNLQEEKTSGDQDTKVYNKYLKKTILKPLRMDDSLYNTTTLHDPERNNEDNPASVNPVKFELIAVPEDALKSNKYVTSGVFRDVNVTESVLALTTKTDYKIYMVNPDNIKKYNQIILYPGNIYTNLFHIHNTYGIYNDDLKVYSVNDKLIISPLNSDKVLDNRAPIAVNVEFDKQSGEGFIARGSYDEIDPYSLQQKKNIVLNHHNVTVQNNTGLIAEVFGNNHVITSRDTQGLNEKEYQTGYFTRTGEFNKMKMYEDVYNNEYSRNNFLNKILNQNMITVRYQNIDIHLDDGLRKFIMNFNNVDYKRFSGEYKCLITTHEFVTQTSGLTTISGSITLRKI